MTGDPAGAAGADADPATEEGAEGLVVLPAAPTTAAAPGRFTGQAWVQPITDGTVAGGARLASVWFAPGARTAWHRHARGQTLHVSGGHGLVQARGGPPVLLVPGGTVWTPPGVWHWHGALPEHALCHLALSEHPSAPGVPAVDWGEPVSDEQHAAAAAAALRPAVPVAGG